MIPARVTKAVFGAQDRLASVLGCSVERRPQIVAAMLHRGPAEVTGYWLQLLIAAGIATLGLVLGSTAVIIGAMLVAPLMTPMVGLGMGLGTGSTVLVLRSSVRVLASVIVVVAMSAGLVRLLPFHEINAEIAARTTPTALDLGTAMFCAMAGVFAAMRPSSDVATTAAGTSIGISLVPPLCVSGYGFGTSSLTIAYGAGLLFLTNFSAIVLVASLSFAAAGFGQIDVERLESAELDETPQAILARPVARKATSTFRTIGGPFFRLLMPVLLLAALYSPLRAGLDHVAWQISARNDVAKAISELPNRVVQSRIEVERRHVRLVIFMLGSHADAIAARETLARTIEASTGVTPLVEVHAVPDSTEFEALEQATKPPVLPIVTAAPPQPPPPPPPPIEAIEEASLAVRGAVERRWPASAGTLFRIDVEANHGGVPRVRFLYGGPPFDEAAHEILETALADDLGGDLELHFADVTMTPIPLTSADPELLAHITVQLERSRSVADLHACAVLPPAPPRFKPDPRAEYFRDALVKLLDAHPRATKREGEAPSVQIVNGPCPPLPGGH